MFCCCFNSTGSEDCTGASDAEVSLTEGACVLVSDTFLVSSEVCTVVDLTVVNIVSSVETAFFVLSDSSLFFFFSADVTSALASEVISVVINSIESHHGDKAPTSVISELVQIADALSAARPGARNDSLENYVKRLEELESIGNNIEGVDKTFAMQAGRELRVVVKPEQIDDLTSYKVAREIKDKIEDTMQYPGTIKVVVIRETRAEEVAK